MEKSKIRFPNSKSPIFSINKFDLSIKYSNNTFKFEHCPKTTF